MRLGEDDPALGYAKKFLRNKLGNTAPKEASLKFINQLRSDLWLIRDIRGTYGTTATSSMMIKEIDRQLSRAKTEADPDEPTWTLRPNWQIEHSHYKLSSFLKQEKPWCSQHNHKQGLYPIFYPFFFQKPA